MDFSVFPTALAATYAADNGGTANVLVRAVRSKGSGAEYLCIDGTGCTFVLDADTITFDERPTGAGVTIDKPKHGSKKGK